MIFLIPVLYVRLQEMQKEEVSSLAYTFSNDVDISAHHIGESQEMLNELAKLRERVQSLHEALELKGENPKVWL